MNPVLGIDLGTTNSVVAIVQDGQATVLKDEQGQAILPSVVGMDSSGQLLVGQAARNQALMAPERTVRSIKRQMGQETKVRLGDQELSPQEVSAIILRTLAQRAEKAYGQPLKQAVITVPAFFNDNQREATREAGSLAGLEVVRIINEPTAASLVYEPHSVRNEKLLVYDLGGGTFDVSIVQIEAGVIEVLSSHGDTQLGGDDFDQLLLNHVADKFLAEHEIDLRKIPVAASRLLQAVEQAKIRLSTDAVTTIAEEFIAEKAGQPLSLQLELARYEYEELIRPLLQKTLKSVDAALEDANLNASQIDRVVLVGGSTRTPLVQGMLHQQLHQELHREIDPDLCVALGAAVQGGLIAGLDVGPVLVDITPHTLGIQCRGRLFGVETDHCFSPIIDRNSPLPATRSDVFGTVYDGQERVEIHVLQGENQNASFNKSIGRFLLEGLDQNAEVGNEILVRFDLNLDGILKVTAKERTTGRSKEVTIDNVITRFRAADGDEARQRLANMFGDAAPAGQASEIAATSASEGQPEDSPFAEVLQSISRAKRLLPNAPAEDAEEMRSLIVKLEQAVANNDLDEVADLADALDEVVFYLQDA